MSGAARFSVGLAVLWLLAACAAHTARTPAAGTEPAAHQSAAPLDASYDWHRQMVMPFGTLLKASPLALHEVLLFQDREAASELGKDCFAVDGKPPRLLDHEPESFLLCFSHDRLDRIETTVRLSAEESAQVIARACALWLKSSPPQPAGDSCEGHDGDITFSAHLERIPGADAHAAASTADAPALLLILAQAAPHDPG